MPVPLRRKSSSLPDRKQSHASCPPSSSAGDVAQEVAASLQFERSVDKVKTAHEEIASIYSAPDPKVPSFDVNGDMTGFSIVQVGQAYQYFVGLQAFLNRTVTGRAMQAVAQNTESARARLPW